MSAPTPGPFEGYGWQLVGGHLALDLVDTVSWQRNPRRATERLSDPARLADWLAVAAPLHGVRSTFTPADLHGAAGRNALAAVRGLRDAARVALVAHVEQTPVDRRVAQIIRDSYYQALAAAEVTPELPFRHRIDVTAPSQIEPLLSLALGELCRRDDLDRLRRCADTDCGWFFLDTSRNHSRRWCDPGDCGNRNRVRAFANRVR
jgi:predicted RNA-binding Zn ribbon-like protein